MKHTLLAFLILILSSCGSIKFNLAGIPNGTVIEKNVPCMKDNECREDKVCAPSRGEYPGWCALRIDPKGKYPASHYRQ